MVELARSDGWLTTEVIETANADVLDHGNGVGFADGDDWRTGRCGQRWRPLPSWDGFSLGHPPDCIFLTLDAPGRWLLAEFLFGIETRWLFPTWAARARYIDLLAQRYGTSSSTPF
jgi:hypothetical protein